MAKTVLEIAWISVPVWPDELPAPLTHTAYLITLVLSFLCPDTSIRIGAAFDHYPQQQWTKGWKYCSVFWTRRQTCIVILFYDKGGSMLFISNWTFSHTCTAQNGLFNNRSDSSTSVRNWPCSTGGGWMHSRKKSDAARAQSVCGMYHVHICDIIGFSVGSKKYGKRDY